MYEPNCGLENVTMSWGHDGKKPFFSFYVYIQFAWSSGKFALKNVSHDQYLNQIVRVKNELMQHLDVEKLTGETPG